MEKLQCEAPKIAKLVYNSYGLWFIWFMDVYGTYNYSCWGESKATYITEGGTLYIFGGDLGKSMEHPMVFVMVI